MTSLMMQFTSEEHGTILRALILSALVSSAACSGDNGNSAMRQDPPAQMDPPAQKDRQVDAGDPPRSRFDEPQ